MLHDDTDIDDRVIVAYCHKIQRTKNGNNCFLSADITAFVNIN